MYRIGEVSSITKISTRMIRYYDKENLLKPSFIGENGYRFYGDKDIEVIYKIKELRRYQFSYEEIKNIFMNNKENDEGIYSDKLIELRSNIENFDNLIIELENRTKVNINNAIMSDYNVSLCYKKPFFALCKKSIVNLYEIEDFIDEIFSIINKNKVVNLGSYFLMFCNNEHLGENLCEIEYYQPTSKSKDVKGFESKYVEEKLYISTIHYGAYDSVYGAYSELHKWANLNGYSIKGNFMEKYYVDSYLTLRCNDYITEVSVEVSKL
ncbi:MAG: MerR family transcriptional regulator [Clostridium sp.]|uniref:MerR family transcriptional regulator n=1 Tax=Clostridium sp. TaxID=1506 RepID=UPI0030527DB6